MDMNVVRHEAALLLLLLNDIEYNAALAAYLLQDKRNMKKTKTPKLCRNGRPRKPRIANRKRIRSTMDREKLQSLPADDFSAGCRMPREEFEQLLALVEPVLHSQVHRRRKLPAKYRDFNRHVDPYVALAFTLRWLSGAAKWDLQYMFNVAKSTLQVWTWRTIRAIIQVLHDNIRFPTDEASLDTLATGFANIAGGLGAAIPNTVCAFDGIVVQKAPPPQEKLREGDYVRTNTAAHFYRKGYFGAAMLAFVDANCRFLSISMACAASCHDSTMYEYSDAGHLLEAGLVHKKYNAVADDAFTTHGHVITPYEGHSLSPQQDAFNYYLSLQRQVVERTFGIWKRKWGIFWKTLTVNEKHVKLVIEVTARLHNFCIDRNVSPSIDDYIVHDARYWRAVKRDPLKHPRISQEVRSSDPVLLDSSEAAGFLPSHFVGGAQERTKRKQICDAIAAQGLLRPARVPLAMQLKRGRANLPKPR
jgi:hypothetical protein